MCVYFATQGLFYYILSGDGSLFNSSLRPAYIGSHIQCSDPMSRHPACPYWLQENLMDHKLESNIHNESWKPLPYRKSWGEASVDMSQSVECSNAIIYIWRPIWQEEREVEHVRKVRCSLDRGVPSSVLRFCRNAQQSRLTSSPRDEPDAQTLLLRLSFS